MRRLIHQFVLGFSILLVLFVPVVVSAQSSGSARSNDVGFGPVMRAYLGYLRNEQEVVDDRASRREITASYYRRNSNRIHALRQMAVRLVRESGNDYVPELEAVTADEFGTLFEHPPKPSDLQSHEVLADKFRFLGSERSGEVFFLFARLDPYEQAELMQKRSKPGTLPSAADGANGQRVGDATTRARRVVPQ